MPWPPRNGTLRRNFQGYTTDASNILLGFGASAIGHLPHGYVQNEVNTRAYLESIAGGKLAIVKGYALTDDDRQDRILPSSSSLPAGFVCRNHIDDCLEVSAGEALATEYVPYFVALAIGNNG